MGFMQWDPSGAVAGYTQDYVSRTGLEKSTQFVLLTAHPMPQVIKVKLRDFQIAEFKEYLDPINKLITAGAPILCFPFFY